MKKLLSFILCVTIALTVIPTTGVGAEEVYLNYKQMDGEDYTSSPILAKKLNQVFHGRLGLYSGGQIYAPLGSSKMTEYRMYSTFDRTTGEILCGWQCYIYANAVYNTLFNENVVHANSLNHSRKVLVNGGYSLSYYELKKAGVRCGAYVRTSQNSSGCYDSDGGHSLVLLSYDKNGITYIEGNADDRGLARAVTHTWSEFNYKQLTRHSKYVLYIVQPYNDYYNDLYYTPKKMKLLKIKQPKGTTVKLKWTRQEKVAGYQIIYSKDRKFTEGNKKINVKASLKSKKIKNLDYDNKYYFRIRAYCETEYGKKVYGKWSKKRKAVILPKEPETDIAPEESTLDIQTIVYGYEEETTTEYIVNN